MKRVTLSIKKSVIGIVVALVLLVGSADSLFSQPPPPPGGGGTGTGTNNNNNQTGGGAPIGSGSVLLIGLAFAYGGKKLYQLNDNNSEKS